MFMCLENDVATNKLYFWSNLYETTTLNPGAAEAKRTRKKVYDSGRALSPVYRKERSLPGPTKGQFTYFHLNPLPPIQDVDKKDEKQPSPQPSSIDSKLKSHSRQSVSSTSSTHLPPFLERPRTEKLFWRRPNVVKAEPLKCNEDLFEGFARMTELKPLSFKFHSDSYRFYREHFPLILQMPVYEERVGSPHRRSLTPESPMSIMIKRQRALNQRVTELNAMVDEMEKATDEDFSFKTELRSPVFDPTSWKWTQIDPTSARRRFTMEACFKDIR